MTPDSRRRRRGVALAFTLLLAACARPEQAPPEADQWHNLEMRQAPVALGAARVGALTFRGGVELHANDRLFGGWSGLQVLSDDRLVAISDNGLWLEAKLDLDAQGTLVGISQARLALLRDEAAVPFRSKEDRDSEDVTQLADGRYAVSFEQSQSIRIYDLNRDGPFGAATPGPPLAQTERLPRNEGLEALTTDPSGALIVGSEHAWPQGHPIWRAQLGATTPAQPIAYLQMPEGYGLSGFGRLPDGDILALERFYAPAVGVRIRIERLSVEALQRGRAEPQLLAALAPPLVLDNFEGISAVRRADGGVRLYVISDDNYNPRQRTLLYAFDLN